MMVNVRWIIPFMPLIILIQVGEILQFTQMNGQGSHLISIDKSSLDVQNDVANNLKTAGNEAYEA